MVIITIFFTLTGVTSGIMFLLLVLSYVLFVVSFIIVMITVFVVYFSGLGGVCEPTSASGQACAGCAYFSGNACQRCAGGFILREGQCTACTSSGGWLLGDCFLGILCVCVCVCVSVCMKVLVGRSCEYA